MTINPVKLLNKIFSTPSEVSADVLNTDVKSLDPEQQRLLVKSGVSFGELNKLMQDEININYERSNLYREVDKSLYHWMMGSSTELYADAATTVSPIHNSSVWVTSTNRKYQVELNKLFDRLGIEERIFDIAWTAAAYGDHFLGVKVKPGLGVISINDDYVPTEVSRLDKDGVLLGFYETPTAGSETKLMPPWEFVHFRLLGAKKRRPADSESDGGAFRSMHILSNDTRRVSNKYGTSILLNGLPVYKRLRLAEDSLLLTRLNKGIIKYIYKVKVNSGNMEAVNEIMDRYVQLFKRARSMDNRESTAGYSSRTDMMTGIEDIIVPVWDDSGNLEIERIGEDSDIRWIADIEMLRNQLASALRVPVQLLGGFVEETSGALGSEASEKLDIRFARSVRRLQRAIREGLTRLCQIHLASKGMDPDPDMFEVHSSDSSTAEEEQFKASLDTGMDVVQKTMDVFDNALGKDYDKAGLLQYLNKKILKLNDAELDKIVTNPQKYATLAEDIRKAIGDGTINESGYDKINNYISDFSYEIKKPVTNLDLYASTPSTDSKIHWQDTYGKVIIECKNN